MAPTKSASWRTHLARWGINLFPCYFATGAKITHVSAEFDEVMLKLPLTWRTRNGFGVLFGGFLYASIDPIYMMMLHKMLGKAYVVWDKSASVQFRRTGTETVYAYFFLSEEVINQIKTAVAADGKVDHELQVELKDANGSVITRIQKVLYIADKTYHEQRLKAHAEKNSK